MMPTSVNGKKCKHHYKTNTFFTLLEIKNLNNCKHVL